jgi:NO-binding membrane sensor protein with MHYT domain
VNTYIIDLQDAASLQAVRNIKHKNVVIAENLFRNPLPLFIGGFFIACGVCIMHYIGMMAMVFDGVMEWNSGT